MAVTDGLDDRKAAVLSAIVEHYIDTAEPVGSGTLKRDGSIEVSTATIRNEMSALEQLGYLSQPYTSAGRVPTEKGYRYFVDQLGGPGVLGPTETRQVRDFFSAAQGAIEDRLRDTSELLSTLTAYTGVVVGPSHDPATIRSAQLVLLGGDRALLVLVLSSGTVERYDVALEGDPSDDLIARVNEHLNRHLIGHGTTPLPNIQTSGHDSVDFVVSTVIGSIVGQPDAVPVFVGSTSNMAAQFDAVDTVRDVLTILEHQLMVVTMVGDLLNKGLSVAIGSETGLPLVDCSVVLAPLVVDGEQAGSVGVLGPTRMDYPRALAAVQVVSRRLGASINANTGDE
ncbi:MAG: heat-inducible transcription repressor HrcA [Actinobacteria bacterium]|nr:heat-inducible transcription repressor HrcA [Actinomycetota bacterium]